MRTAYKCRAYPAPGQASVLSRTFGCVRVVWNRTLARHDRDINAAKNILAAGLAVAGGDPGDACGADVRHSGSSRVQSAMKQEPPGVSPGIPVLQGRE